MNINNKKTTWGNDKKDVYVQRGRIKFQRKKDKNISLYVCDSKINGIRKDISKVG